MYYYSWVEDYLARLDGKEARREYYERYYASWHEAVQKLAEAILEYHAMLSHFSAETQEHQAQLTRSFFEGVAENLRAQTEGNLAASQELVQQTRRWQEAAQSLTQDSVNAYIDFLDSVFFSYYRPNMRAAEGSDRE